MFMVWTHTDQGAQPYYTIDQTTCDFFELYRWIKPVSVPDCTILLCQECQA